MVSRYRASLIVLGSLSSCEPVGGVIVRQVELDAGATVNGADDGARSVAGPETTARLGYYFAAFESEHEGPVATLNDVSCSPLASTPAAFADEACIQGVGRLRDGRVLQFASNCACGLRCSSGGQACFELLDADALPFGRGSSGRALLPLRSLAVSATGPFANRVLYAPALDGLVVNASLSSTGFVHDGCLRGDDSGVFTDATTVRLFAGDARQYAAVRAILPTSLALFESARHCEWLAP